MALTCSVLGHAYGDPTVERDREERGSEVVVTIREYETCHRCGTTRIVSENKEVTAVEAEGTDEPEPDRQEPAEAPDAVAAATPSDPVQTDPDDDAGESDPPAAPAEPGDGGAEIMDAEAEAPVDEELASPSVTEPDDEADAPAEDDAVVLEDDGDAGEERAPGEWPEEEPAEDDDWTPENDPDDGPDVERAIGQTITVPDGEFHCEECDYTTSVEASSLRAGDFCPECHRGTLEHVREE